MKIPHFNADDGNPQQRTQTDLDGRFIYIWQDLPAQKSDERLVAEVSPQTSTHESPRSKGWYFMTVWLLLLTLGTFALQSRAAITDALSIHGDNILTEIGIPIR